MDLFYALKTWPMPNNNLRLLLVLQYIWQRMATLNITDERIYLF